MKVLGTILLRVPQLCWDWMDCTGLCKNFTIEDCTELQQDCLDCLRIVTDLWPCNRHFNPTNPFTIDKILTKSNFLINVNVVQLRDFSGSVYANFPQKKIVLVTNRFQFEWDWGQKRAAWLKQLKHCAGFTLHNSLPLQLLNRVKKWNHLRVDGWRACIILVQIKLLHKKIWSFITIHC